MNEFTYENQGTNTYLVYSVTQEDEIDTMSLGMLTNNKIPGLAPVLFTQMDADRYLKYNISAKISVKQFFSEVVNSKRLIGVFTGIVNAMLSAEDYMIDTNTIVLDLDHIYSDVSTCETVVVCLPIAIKTKNQELGTFFKNIMFNTRFDQTENCDYVAKIINYLNSTPVFSLMDFNRLLDDVKEKQIPTKQNSSPVVITPANKTQPTIQHENPVPSSNPISHAGIKQPLVQPQNTSQSVPIKSESSQKETTSNEKKMSWFYLMQHYNAENAAIYKAQKGTKNNGIMQQSNTSKKDKPQNVPSAPAVNVGFAIPGQQIPMSPSQPQIQQKVMSQPTQNKASASVSADQPYVSSQPSVPQSKPMSFGETTVLGGGSIGETTVLNAGVQQKQAVIPHLIRSKNNERIMIDKPVYRIGKEKSYVDYFIGDNTAISRSHANIVTRDGKYYIVDTNSTNHTFVDGSMIQSNSEVEISHGTKIRLANEDFIFNLY